MRTLLRTWSLFGIGVVVLLGLALGTSAQTRESPPTIIVFSADRESLTLADVESDPVSVTLSWHVLNLNAPRYLTLETYRLNVWEPVVEEEAILLAHDSQTITVQHSLTFRPPTYRLAIRNEDQSILDAAMLVIPYVDDCETDCEPIITEFRVVTESVEAEALANRTAVVPVAWSVANRPPTANPVFEQVLDDGNAVLVELPRDALWIPSVGHGVVAPIATVSSAIHIRMRLVDLVSSEILAETTVDVPVDRDGGG